MKQANFDTNSLAARMELDRDGRKWLGRLLSDGLDRTNSKSEPKLQQLCECLGLESTKQLWDASLSLTASDDFHINTVRRLLKQGGSPAEYLRISIEFAARTVGEIESFLASHSEPVGPIQKRKVVDCLFEYLCYADDASLTHLELTDDELDSLDDDWPTDPTKFIRAFQEEHPKEWQRFEIWDAKVDAESEVDTCTPFETIQYFITANGSSHTFRWLLKAFGDIDMLSLILELERKKNITEDGSCE
ncbi:hypothetical protein Fuma_02893 [Fuerstiella marisgermanici]|uniref:Uncharacterized protein n=2 Tax=Fuerstiella marisgermanici TaxID=1891926 RepID=A0A1P8WGS1_9PLAN|nr:hypothetical protein Fuma_02893 [Fuerstiella marisgermanici]